MEKIILFVLLLMNTTSYSQMNIDSVLAKANRIINKKVTENQELQKEVLMLRGKVNEQTQTEASDIKLKGTIQKLEFANLKIERNVKELKEAKAEMSKVKSENAKLKQKNEELTLNLSAGEQLRKEQKDYDSSLIATLQAQNKLKLYDEAKQAAKRDFIAGKSETQVEKEPSGFSNFLTDVFDEYEPLLFVAVGYNVPGFILHASFGGTFTAKNNIYIGLGTGYDEFTKNGQFELMPFYLSTKVALMNEFLDANGIKKQEYFLWHVLGDFGVSKLLQHGRTNYSSGGFFMNVGLGISRQFGTNVSGTLEASFRKQGMHRIIDNVKETLNLNTVNIKIGLGIYLKQ